MRSKHPLPLSTSLACAFVWAAMLFFIALTPYMIDNFLFSRDMLPGYAAFMSGMPIERLAPLTLEGALRQAVEMYGTWCGRFTGNLLVYLIFMLPYAVYALLAATAFVLYIFLLLACIWGRHWREKLNAGWVLGLSALLWAGQPSFGSAFFWISLGGYMALIGQAAFLLPYRLALDSNADAPEAPAARCFLFFIIGMFVASLDYPSSAAMPVAALACTAWLYFRRPPEKRRLPRLPLAGALGVSLGGAITLLAPGNAGRLRLTTDQSVHDYLASTWGERIISYLLNLPQALLIQGVPLLLLLWACWALYRRYGKSWPTRLPQPFFLFLLPALATHGAYLFTAWPPQRAFATTAAQLTVAACIAAWTALPVADARSRRYFVLLRTALCVFCICSLIQEAWNFHLVHEATQAREAIYAAHKGKDARVPPLPVRGDRHMVLGSHLQDISPEPTHWVNRAVAAWYGLKSVAVADPPPRRLTPLSRQRPVALEALADTFKIQIRYTPPAGAPRPDEIHVYYYGNPGLLGKLPESAANAVFRWLEKGQDGDLRLLLVPILCARADIRLHWNGTGQGSTQLWGQYPLKSDMWLVTPGSAATSFDLLPLRNAPPLR